jgi:nicotinate phosphoribosyltransferase
MIIPSLLDTDLYKFTMMQVVLHHFPGAQVEYRFKCRNPDVDLTPYVGEIRARDPAALRAAIRSRRARVPAQLALLQERFRRPLGLFRSTSASSRSIASPGRTGRSTSRSGPWLHTIMFEVPVLAIVSEVYDRNQHRGAGSRRGDGGASPRR